MTISRREFVKGIGAGILCAVVPKIPFAAPPEDKYRFHTTVNCRDGIEFHGVMGPLRIFMNGKEVFPTKDYTLVEQDNGTAYIVFERVNLEDFI